MKKTIIGLLSALTSLIIMSCNADMAISDMDDPGVLTRALTIGEFYELVQTHANDFSRQNAPESVNGEIFHQTLFAAVTGRYIVSGEFGDRDAYSGVYHSWNRASELTQATSTRSLMSAEQEKTALDKLRNMEPMAEVPAPRTSDPREYYRQQGQYFTALAQQMMSVTGSDDFLNTADAYRRAHIEHYTPLVIPGSGAFEPLLEILTLKPVIADMLNYRDDSPTWNDMRPYPGCFLFHDGIYRMDQKNIYSEVSVELIRICLSVLAGETRESRLMEFLDGLVDICTRSDVTAIFPEVDLLLKAIGTGVNASVFWREILYPESIEPYIEITPSDISFSEWGASRTVEIKSHGVEWRAVFHNMMWTHSDLPGGWRTESGTYTITAPRNYTVNDRSESYLIQTQNPSIGSSYINIHQYGDYPDLRLSSEVLYLSDFVGETPSIRLSTGRRWIAVWEIGNIENYFRCSPSDGIGDATISIFGMGPNFQSNYIEFRTLAMDGYNTIIESKKLYVYANRNVPPIH